MYFDGRRPTNPDEVPVRYSLPPRLGQAFGRAQPVIHHLGRAITATERACKKRKGTVLGPMAVTRQHPWSEPRSPRTFSSGSVPSFMVTRSEELRVQCALETTAFRKRHEACQRARLAGEDPEFPYGTYAMRVFHGARVEDPSELHEWAINAPGWIIDPQPLDTPTRHALTTELRKDAACASEPGDLLADRIVEGNEDAVDRQGPRTVVPNAALEPSSERQPQPKRVVLRGSTHAASARRRLKQQARDRQPPFDPDPPPE